MHGQSVSRTLAALVDEEPAAHAVGPKQAWFNANVDQLTRLRARGYSWQQIADAAFADGVYTVDSEGRPTPIAPDVTRSYAKRAGYSAQRRRQYIRGDHAGRSDAATEAMTAASSPPADPPPRTAAAGPPDNEADAATRPAHTSSADKAPEKRPYGMDELFRATATGHRKR